MSQVPSKKPARATKSHSTANRGGRVAVRLKEHATHAPRTGVVSKPGGNGKAPRGSDVRERILKVALEYFGTFGFEGTSTRAVAERARVGHTLVLYHFKFKDQLWIATVEEALKTYKSVIRELVESSAQRPAKETLANFIEHFVRMSAERPQIHRLMTMESNQNTPRLAWIIEHFLREHFTFVRDVIRRGQTDGTVRQCDPARLYYLILGAGGTPFTLRTEYEALTGRDVFSEPEILRNIALIYELVFI